MADVAKPGDARFFERTGPHTLQTLAALAGAQTQAGERLIHGVAPLQTAGPLDVTFLDNRRYADLLPGIKAGAVIVHPDFASRVPEETAALVTREPYVAWAKISALFHPFPRAKAGIHASAVIDPSATIDPTAEIGAHAVIGARVEIGAGTIIGPLSLIADGVIIGAECRIHAQVSVSHAVIGNRVVLYPGARIGQDGFGFAISPTGFTPVPQLGRVLIGDGAEIGANTCIDRGSAQDTVIGPGVHIDNLVQIGHNVNIGSHAVIVAQAGVSGSTAIGPQVMIAAQAGLTGHLTIGRGARIGAQAGVMTDIAPGEEVMGSPSQPSKTFFREVITLRKLAQYGRKSKNAGG
ncbi:UDP-3-O-(3-hydroxymyristoyl)glucosamine N-acyltransferase [Acidocella sp.]|uniref:UDP-3-O-(3-hydroxymyristoyl)glucosamine N-acyltransferase n=1 Tax=Acidocella sp. TaxID=50710 RepID=UPI002619C1DA|nr:UDP-3-O-(3-hydroxymyristoyl)glucosamine N-acyltransferase [Acidocella sp.]MDD2794915.1 UDP-3-O-(3-hydroxymyristoyl)glucosamine N-acyltransferase [Acidocella sp.]